MERGKELSEAERPQTPLEGARTNPAVRESFLRALAAKLRGEKLIPATELMAALAARRNRAEI